MRRFGMKVYFGDPTRADVLRAAGAEQAKLLVVALDNPRRRCAGRDGRAQLSQSRRSSRAPATAATRTC